MIMEFMDRPLGSDQPRLVHPGHAAQLAPANYHTLTHDRGQDDVAVERYRYLLRTAPPDSIEEAHAEAFAQLTHEQRQQVLAQLGAEIPDRERPTSAEPRTLARAATRAEMRASGTIERALGGRPAMGVGEGLGGRIVGNLLSSVAGAFVGTAIARTLFYHDETIGEAGGDTAPAEPSGHESAAGPSDADADDASAHYGAADYGAADYGGAAYGADVGGFGDF